MEAAGRLEVSTPRHLRFQAVAAQCRQAREEIGRGVKEVAQRLGVAQYRLDAIELGCFGEIWPQVLKTYIGFLGLDSWLRRRMQRAVRPRATLLVPQSY